MAVVLQVVSFPPAEAGADAGKDHEARRAALRAASQPGCLRVYVGREVENPAVPRMFSEWEPAASIARYFFHKGHPPAATPPPGAAD